MNYRQLQYAVMLAEVRNFSEAAQRLDISQPALSKQIIGLETELGVKLFDRSTMPLSLTSAGEFFVQRAEELLFEEDVLIKTMSRYRSGEYGKLTIGVSPFRSLYLMPPVVRALKEKYPHLSIVLGEYGREHLHKGISDGLYDFVITNLPVDDSILEAIPLERDSLVLAVPNELRHMIDKETVRKNGNRQSVNLSGCGKLPFVVVSKGQEMRQLFDKLCRFSRIEPQIYMEVVGITTAWAMAQAGLAATILPVQFMRSELLNSNITIFEIDQSTFIRQPAIVTRRGQFISEYAQYAIDLLREAE